MHLAQSSAVILSSVFDKYFQRTALFPPFAEIKINGHDGHPRGLLGNMQQFGTDCTGKQIFFCQASAVVKYIRPAALILHPVTLMIQSTQYKY